MVTGRGFGHGTPTAAVAEIEVNKTTGKITVKYVYCAASTPAT
jgi:hypothetical protein